MFRVLKQHTEEGKRSEKRGDRHLGYTWVKMEMRVGKFSGALSPNSAGKLNGESRW